MLSALRKWISSQASKWASERHVQSGGSDQAPRPALRKSKWRYVALFIVAACICIIFCVKQAVVRQLASRAAQSLDLWRQGTDAFFWEGLVGFSLGALLALWLVPRWQVARLTATSEVRFDKENEARKTFAQILGGVFVIGGFFFTAKTLQVSQQQAAIAAQQVAIAQEGQFTDRFTKAIDQLGNREKLDLRIGAIYALERIAKDSPKDHWPVIEVLAAYIRENAPRPMNWTARDGDKRLPIDVQAAIAVIGRRTAVRERRPNTRSYFEPGLESYEAQLNSLHHFQELIEGRFDVLQLANVDIHHAKLMAADLRDAQLNDSIIAVAVLAEADLRGANLENADLSLSDLNRAQLTGARLEHARLNGATLIGAALQGANLYRASLKGVNLFRADLREATLDKADLSGATLDATNLESAGMEDTDIRGVDLSTTGVNQEQVNASKGDWSTKLPAGIIHPPSWKAKDSSTPLLSRRWLVSLFLCPPMGAIFAPIAEV